MLDQWIWPVMWASSKPRDHQNNHCCLCKQCAGAQAQHKMRQGPPRHLARAREQQVALGTLGNLFLVITTLAHSPFLICTMLSVTTPIPLDIYTQYMHAHTHI